MTMADKPRDEEEEQSPGVQYENPEKAAGYVKLRNALWVYGGLSDGAILTYLAIKHFAWQDPETYVGQQTLAELRGCSVATISAHTSELKDAGLIKTIRRGQGKTTITLVPDIPRNKQLQYLKRWKPDIYKAVIQTSEIRSQDLEKPELDVNSVNINSLDENGRQAADAAPSPSQVNSNDKQQLIAGLAAEFAPRENPKAVLTLLSPFASRHLLQAAEVARGNDGIENPIAYLLGTVRNLSEAEGYLPAAQQPAPELPTLTEAEYKASLQALERIKQQLSQ